MEFAPSPGPGNVGVAGINLGIPPGVCTLGVMFLQSGVLRTCHFLKLEQFWKDYKAVALRSAAGDEILALGGGEEAPR